MEHITLHKAAGHLRTITKHHHLVMGYCFRAGLYRQGIMHDLSKFSPEEFLVGARYWQEGRRSPNNAEREATGLSRSWLHHKGRNKHHYEYWIDYALDSPNGLGGGKMPRRYVAEMIFDRVSASKVYKGVAYTDSCPLEYFMNGKDKCWYIHKTTLAQMEFLLCMWAERGEDYTIRYIRKVFLKGRR